VHPCRVEKFQREIFVWRKQLRNLLCIAAARHENGNEGRRNRHDVTTRIKAIEINDVKLLGGMFLAGSTVSIGE